MVQLLEGVTIPLSFLREGRPPPGISLGEFLAERIGQASCVKTLLDCLPSTPGPAIYSPDTSCQPLRHHDLLSFVKQFVLPHSPNRPALGANDRIMIALPTGPENALALLALASYHTCAPVNASATAAELYDDSKRLRAKAIVTVQDAEERLELRKLQEDIGCDVIYIVPRGSRTAGLFDMVVMGTDHPEIPDRPSTLHGLEDISLVLHTSGTSGKKKVVPYPLRTLIVGTWSVVHSWNLQCGDVNMNMMPLFHVGGIVRNLLAPVLSGGSAIMCSNFDPIAFWDLAPRLEATWYYAAPTIHHAILLAKPSDVSILDNTKIRMICNAAGGLLPSLAVEMKRVFGGAVILPSYGMTECMPIATPLQNYQLDRPGTSGLACGPYMSIRDPYDIEIELPFGKTGSICVRGLPTFDGYEVSAEQGAALDTSAFSIDGWFDSGDVGYMDTDGYLFVTGRSKEIINRGGEVISPFEIEEAISIAAKDHIKNSLSFSVNHDVLQETIGVVIVPHDNRPRIGLHQLNDLLKDRLHPSKWPFLIVYMSDIPKNSAGKPLRIKLGTRLGFEIFGDTVPTIHRHFEADVPHSQSPLSAPISCKAVSVCLEETEQALTEVPGVQEVALRTRDNGSMHAYLSLNPNLTPTISPNNIKDAISHSLPGYSIPEALYTVTAPLHRLPSGDIDFDRIESDVTRRNASGMEPTQVLIRDIVAEMLLIEPGVVTLQSDFFLLGGNSLLLGKLSYNLRKQAGVNISAADLFTQSTIAGIASLVDSEQKCLTNKASTVSMAGTKRDLKYRQSTMSALTAVHEHNVPVFEEKEEEEPETEPPRRRGPNHPLCLLIQIIPFIFFYPLKTALAWSMLLFVLAYLARYFREVVWLRMTGLAVAIVIARLSARLVCPLGAIAFKWIVIGKYKPGTYRTWSSYYLRWWIVNQSLRAAGRGVFATNPTLGILYYRMLGAKIGRNVHIDSSARLAECDLITLHDGCRVDSSLIRGFCVERDGYIRLGRIVIGARAVINTYTVVSPGAIIPDGAVYGPHASSHELPSPRSYAAYNRTMFAKPHWFLQVVFGYPIILSVIFFSYLPWFSLIWFMMQTTFAQNEGYNAVDSVILWFSTPHRVFLHFCARMVHVVLRPLIHVFLSILVKRAMGLNRECKAKDATQFSIFRRYVNSVLLSRRALKNAFSILGTHYEVVSVVFRLMGAKVGRRIYWPGSGVYCLDPELLEVGDDVVFGSRSELHTTNSLGSAKIVIGSGAMIADRVVLLPGTRVGKRTVMGSGSLGKPSNDSYEDGSTWMGNGFGQAVRLSRGSNQMNLDENMLTPFGKAFYKRQADYFVFPYSLLVMIHILSAIVTVVYWSISAVAAAQFLRLIVLGLPHTRLFHPSWYRFGVLYGLIGIAFIVVLNIQAVLAILWVVATKWIIIGRRHDGRYDWDRSSYCQRWQLHLVLSRVIHKGYGNGGVLASLTGTSYFVWYLRALGAGIGKNCAIYVGGRMGLMTEPELVELGDDVNLDNCSVVAHINSRGNFSLNSLKIGNGCALRTGSRLLSGASMEDHSMLCEHTLIASGEVAEEGAAYVGWPGKKFDPDADTDSYTDSISETQVSMFMCHLCRQLPKDCTVTDCGHLYCESCIISWMKKTGKCPVCIEPLSKRRLTKLQLASTLI